MLKSSWYLGKLFKDVSLLRWYQVTGVYFKLRVTPSDTAGLFAPGVSQIVFQSIYLGASC